MADTPDWTNPATATGIATLQASVDEVVANTNPLNAQPVNAQVTVTTVATLLRTTVTKESLAIFNNDSTNPVYVGPSNVATSGANKGLTMLAGGYLTYDFDAGVSLYAIASVAAVVLTVQRIAWT